MLRVSRVPPGDPTIEQYVGQNRFECLTCPYQFVINKRYYERKYLKKKEVEDILGGKGAWDNVDKTEGTLLCFVWWRRRMARKSWRQCLGEAAGIEWMEADSEQSNVRTKSAATTRRTGTSCRFAVQTSR